ncbi:hypothetical protein [Cellulosilyticum ruminicola]|uniref:hypothetical protein n=1 Tax=Cellulosilyticum ruminicola TaxID=425254 RepID=UPI0012EEDCBE|nr:hypothetical protein [Cellulosilyticum ruminicola]
MRKTLIGILIGISMILVYILIIGKNMDLIMAKLKPYKKYKVYKNRYVKLKPEVYR